MIAGIQPTYEELKPKAAQDLAQAANRIQPTYEELKPAYGAIVTGMELVSSLPMRN